MKILIVDDEALVGETCRRILEGAGYDVSTVRSGAAAVERMPEGWDIILTDLELGDSFNGIEIVKQARRHGNADVILMTGFPEIFSVIEALRQGAYDYLIKPVSKDVLRMTVQRCVDKRNLSVELQREKALRAQLEEAHRELTQMGKVKETFGQFITPEVAQFVLGHPDDFWRSGEQRSATVLFADVRNFTPFAESVTPQEAVQALNRIFACMIEATQEAGGILNKFMGDGMLALFGAPVQVADHAAAAARAALKGRACVEALNQRLRIGIGINTGEMIAGCIGTKERAEYSVIGHSVNLGARLQKIAAAGQILVGSETARLLEKNFQVRNLGERSLAGVSQAMQVFELVRPK